MGHRPGSVGAVGCARRRRLPREARPARHGNGVRGIGICQAAHLQGAGPHGRRPDDRPARRGRSCGATVMASQLIGPSAASSLVDALALLLLATGFLTVAARRLVLSIWTLALQSSLLVLVAATVAASSGAAHVWAMVACTLVI